MPQKSIDPVVMAASAVMRLQTVVSREVAMTDSAVVTVGTLRAGMNENVIPDHALLRLNIRTFKDDVRTRVLAAVKRILEAEAAASGAPRPPEFAVLSEYPLTRNDESATRRAVAALEQHFGSLERLRGKKLAMSWAYSPSYGKPLSVPQGIIALMTRFGMDVTLAHPEGYNLLDDVVSVARKNAAESGGGFKLAIADLEHRDVLVAESIEPARRGSAFGLLQAMDSAGAIAGPA